MNKDVDAIFLEAIKQDEIREVLEMTDPMLDYVDHVIVETMTEPENDSINLFGIHEEESHKSKLRKILSSDEEVDFV